RSVLRGAPFRHRGSQRPRRATGRGDRAAWPGRRVGGARSRPTTYDAVGHTTMVDQNGALMAGSVETPGAAGRAGHAYGRVVARRTDTRLAWRSCQPRSRAAPRADLPLRR